MAIAQSRKFMAQLAEPGGRERLIEQHRSMIRSSEVGLAAYLHFDADQYARFVNLRAEQDLKLREHTTHCMLDEHCSFKDPNFRSSSKDISESTNRDIASMFGAETVERYQFFLYSGTQRETVTQLRGRLSDSARLSDAKADQLIRAWMDEAASINEDMKSVGYGVGMYNSVAYAVMQEDPDGKRAAAAAEYNRRIRDRAATVLSNEQLAVYTQMQSEALEQARQINSTTREN